jgi:hypothetical protein
MQVRKLILVLSCAAVTALLAASAFSALASNSSEHEAVTLSQSTCDIGGSPTLDLLRYFPGRGKPLIPATVIGCGKSTGGSIELVATYTTKAFCFAIDRIQRMSSEGGECKPKDVPWKARCSELCVYSVLPVDLGHSRRLRHTIVSGQALPSASYVRIIANDGSKRLESAAVPARVIEADLLKAIRQTEPFFVFGAVLPRCISARFVQVVAEDEAGKVIARSRGRTVPSNPCQAPPLPNLPPG